MKIDINLGTGSGRVAGTLSRQVHKLPEGEGGLGTAKRAGRKYYLRCDQGLYKKKK
jgi:hypothetical protein